MFSANHNIYIEFSTKHWATSRELYPEEQGMCANVNMYIDISTNSKKDSLRTCYFTTNPLVCFRPLVRLRIRLRLMHKNESYKHVQAT